MTMTPFEMICEDLWNNPGVRLQGREKWDEFLKGLALMHGVVDRLTPGFVVYKHNSPNCPGDLRVKLAKDGVVIIQYFFRECPKAKMEVVIPIDKFKEGMEKTVDLNFVVNGLVKMLLQRGHEGAIEAGEAVGKAEPPKPKLVLPP